jgi:hypothetical protein
MNAKALRRETSERVDLFSDIQKMPLSNKGGILQLNERFTNG